MHSNGFILIGNSSFNLNHIVGVLWDKPRDGGLYDIVHLTDETIHPFKVGSEQSNQLRSVFGYHS